MRASARARANRRNAKRSTGPRTIAGKAKVARNSLQHGLSVPIGAVPELNAAATKLANLLLGARTDPRGLDAARRIASAQVEIGRARLAKFLLMEKLKSPNQVDAVVPRRSARSIHELNERAAEIRRIQSRPADPKEAHPAIAVQSLSEELSKLDRYERRALSRRKFAMREMEASIASITAQSDASTTSGAI